MFVPIQCTLYRNPSAAKLSLSDGVFEVIERYCDRTDHAQMLLGCTECGQRYFYEFYEIEDWDSGDDAMYSTYVPVRNSHDIERLKALASPMDLLKITPRIQDDLPAGGRRKEPEWVGLPGEDD